MAFELIKNSVDKIIHPTEVEFSLLAMGILVASILVKIYMYFYNQQISKKIDSAAMKATAVDSLSDTLATTVVLIAAIVAKYTGLQVDGYCGVLVACLSSMRDFQQQRIPWTRCWGSRRSLNLWSGLKKL